MLSQFEEAKELHRQGDLAAAVALYRQVVAKEPQNVDAWNMLGNALFDQRELSLAVDAYRRALEIDAHSPKLHFNLGNALFAMDLMDDAIKSYQRALAGAPQNAAAHFNLGNAYYDLQQYNEAIDSYRRALQCCETPDPDIAYNLGKALFDAGRFEEAVSAYGVAILQAPDFFQAHSNLGLTLFELDRMPEAIQSHRRALQLNPHEASEHFLLGRALMTVGNLKEAEVALRQALRENPRASPVYEMLGRILLLQQREADLEILLQQWEQELPGNARVAHMRAAWLQTDPQERAADDYIRSMFDGFADTFDSMLRKLKYQAPQLVADALQNELPDQSGGLVILDAGCGTGLSGVPLRPLARELWGVDLSPGMLDVARKRGNYDHLAAAELTAYLRGFNEHFDVIASADTLVYFGELLEPLNAACRALRPRGLFVFTVEADQQSSSERGYCLTASGRYAHTEEYLARVLEQCQLTRRRMDRVVLRFEAGHPVAGFLVVAAKEK